MPAGTIHVQQVESADPMCFDVTLQEGKSATRHRVTMTRATCQKLTGGTASPARCIEAAFKFLLDHEPKESILSCFDVTVISTYFPSFEREVGRYIGAR
jgi:hypothetical protein